MTASDIHAAVSSIRREAESLERRAERERAYAAVRLADTILTAILIYEDEAAR